MKKGNDMTHEIRPQVQQPEIKTGLMTPGASSRKPRLSHEEMRKKIAAMRERDEEMVTGIFKNLENPATNGSLGMAQFGFKKYHGQDYDFYELHDGERYTIPRMVAIHLNNDCYYKEYQHCPNEFGSQGMRQAAPVRHPNGRMVTHSYQQARKIHRYAFHPLDFTQDDTEMYPSSLVEVSAAL